VNIRYRSLTLIFKQRSTVQGEKCPISFRKTDVSQESDIDHCGTSPDCIIDAHRRSAHAEDAIRWKSRSGGHFL
jgi:hypothetical protein